jgi:hypothetical protein
MERLGILTKDDGADPSREVFTPQGSRVEEVGVEGKGRRELLSSRGGWQAAW